MRSAGLFLLGALMETVVQPPLLWTGGGQQPLTTLHRPRLGLQSHGLLPWMSSPLSCVRHTALDLGPTLNPGCAHLKIFSLIPSEKSLLQMRSCSQAPGTVFWRGHHSTCDIHQDWGHQVPESDVGRFSVCVSSDPWAARFSPYPIPRPPGTTPLALVLLLPPPSFRHPSPSSSGGRLPLLLVQVKHPGSGVDSSPSPTSDPIGSSMGSSPEKTQNPLTSHHLPPHTAVCP